MPAYKHTKKLANAVNSRKVRQQRNKQAPTEKRVYAEGPIQPEDMFGDLTRRQISDERADMRKGYQGKRKSMTYAEVKSRYHPDANPGITQGNYG